MNPLGDTDPFTRMPCVECGRAAPPFGPCAACGWRYRSTAGKVARALLLAALVTLAGFAFVTAWGCSPSPVLCRCSLAPDRAELEAYYDGIVLRADGSHNLAEEWRLALRLAPTIATAPQVEVDRALAIIRQHPLPPLDSER